jgi:hypothetical protein
MATAFRSPEELREAEDCHQLVVEVVRHGRGEQANRFEPLRANEPRPG